MPVFLVKTGPSISTLALHLQEKWSSGSCRSAALQLLHFGRRELARIATMHMAADVRAQSASGGCELTHKLDVLRPRPRHVVEVAFAALELYEDAAGQQRVSTYAGLQAPRSIGL